MSFGMVQLRFSWLCSFMSSIVVTTYQRFDAVAGYVPKYTRINLKGLLLLFVAVSWNASQECVSACVVLVDRMYHSGRYPSLALLQSGVPAVAHIEASTGQLRYLRAKDPLGIEWHSPIVVSVQSRFASLVLLSDGRPIIAFVSLRNETLQVALAEDYSGDTWHIVTVTNNVEYISANPTLRLLGNNALGIAYMGKNFDLRFAFANDASGLSWTTDVVIDECSLCGWRSSLTILYNNQPAVAYLDSMQIMYFARAMFVNGSVWGIPVVIGAFGSSGRFSLTLLDDFKPAISHVSGSELWFVVAGDTLGSSWGLPIKVDTVGRQPSTTILRTTIPYSVAITYFDGAADALQCAVASSANLSDWLVTTVDDSIYVGSIPEGGYVSMATLLDGRLAVAYYDHGSIDLRYAVADDLSGTSWTSSCSSLTPQPTTTLYTTSSTNGATSDKTVTKQTNVPKTSATATEMTPSASPSVRPTQTAFQRTTTFSSSKQSTLDSVTINTSVVESSSGNSSGVVVGVLVIILSFVCAGIVMAVVYVLRKRHNGKSKPDVAPNDVGSGNVSVNVRSSRRRGSKLLGSPRHLAYGDCNLREQSSTSGSALRRSRQSERYSNRSSRRVAKASVGGSLSHYNIVSFVDGVVFPSTTTSDTSVEQIYNTLELSPSDVSVIDVSTGRPAYQTLPVPPLLAYGDCSFLTNVDKCEGDAE